MRGVLVLFPAFVALGGACAPSAKTSRAPATSPATAADVVRPAPGYGDSCISVITHARRVPTEPLLSPPVVSRMDFAPFFNPPARLRGQRFTLHVEVDSAGGVTAARMEPAADSAFTQRVLQALRGARFHPALLHGCGVPGRATITMDAAR